MSRAAKIAELAANLSDQIEAARDQAATFAQRPFLTSDEAKHAEEAEHHLNKAIDALDYLWAQGLEA